MIPIYEERGRTYEADTCLPVVRASQAGRLRHFALIRGHYPGKPLARNALTGVKCIGYWDAAEPQDWGLDWHRNEGIELTFLESGRLGFAVEKQTFQLKAGDMTVTRPWQQHRVGDPHVAPGRLHFLILDVGVRRPHQSWRWPSWIVLTPTDLHDLTTILRHNEQPVWRVSPEIEKCFSRIGAAVETDQDGSKISTLTVLVNQLFLLLLEMFRFQKVHLDQSLSSAQRTVELFWSDVAQDARQLALEWSVRGMARRCGMGATNFIRHTRQSTNMTPMQYLNHCRLQLAAQWLHDRADCSITDIALACGFASSQYFATLFRRKYGISPRAFRDDRDKCRSAGGVLPNSDAFLP